MFYNTKNGVPFEVYLTEEQRRQFLELVQRAPGQAMLIFSRFSTRQSTCWVLNDQLRIHSLIESSVGFEAVDRQVHEAIARALHVDHAPSHAQQQQQQQQQSQDKRLYLSDGNKEFLLNWFQAEGLISAEKEAKNVDAITVHFN